MEFGLAGLAESVLPVVFMLVTAFCCCPAAGAGGPEAIRAGKPANAPLALKPMANTNDNAARLIHKYILPLLLAIISPPPVIVLRFDGSIGPGPLSLNRGRVPVLPRVLKKGVCALEYALPGTHVEIAPAQTT